MYKYEEVEKLRFKNKEIDVILGDIISQKVDVIVNSDDSNISMGGSVSLHSLCFAMARRYSPWKN